MKRFSHPLSNVHVASPCHADWDQMIGNDRIRFCGQCTLHVYNLSSMSRREAEQLIEHNEGRLCIRYYKRVDGSIITRNCPIGLQAIKRRMSYLGRAVSSAVLTFFAGLGLYEVASSIAIPEPPQLLMGKRAVMGDIAAPAVVRVQKPLPTVGITMGRGLIKVPIKQNVRKR